MQQLHECPTAHSLDTQGGGQGGQSLGLHLDAVGERDEEEHKKNAYIGERHDDEQWQREGTYDEERGEQWAPPAKPSEPPYDEEQWYDKEQSEPAYDEEEWGRGYDGDQWQRGCEDGWSAEPPPSAARWVSTQAPRGSPRFRLEVPRPSRSQLPAEVPRALQEQRPCSQPSCKDSQMMGCSFQLCGNCCAEHRRREQVQCDAHGSASDRSLNRKRGAASRSYYNAKRAAHNNASF